MADPDIFADVKRVPASSSQDADIFKDVEAPPKKLKIGAEGLPDAVRATMPEFNWLSRAGMGAYSTLDDAALRLKQVSTDAYNAIRPQKLTDLIVGSKSRELTVEDQQRALVNRAVRGDTAAMIGGIAPHLALAPVAGPGLIGNAAVGAGTGFLTQPVLPGESGVSNAGSGLLGGAAGWGAGKLLTGSPLIAPSQQTQRLLDEGIVPTIGQNAASKGLLGRALGNLEERASSLPVVGDFIRGSRGRSIAEFNQAAVGKAMPPGETTQQLGAKAVEEAKEALGRAYDDVYRGVRVAPDQALRQGVDAAKVSTALPLNKAQAKAFDDTLNRNLWEKLPQGQVEAGLVKMEMESKIAKASRDAYASGDHALGEALKNARDVVRDWLNRNIGADSAALPGLNQARANLEAVKKAADRAKAEGGIFTPYQLQQASKIGPMRELADTAQAVLPSRVSNSNATDRALVAGLLTGNLPTGTLSYLGGSLLTSPFYSRLGSRFLLGDLTPEALQQTSPLVSQAVRGYLLQ